MALFGFNRRFSPMRRSMSAGQAAECHLRVREGPEGPHRHQRRRRPFIPVSAKLQATEFFKSLAMPMPVGHRDVQRCSKLQPSLESLLKLAELYTEQGLFNDARAQYLQVAEEFLKARRTRETLSHLPEDSRDGSENSSMRINSAEVYVRLGKKNEAWQIFSAAADAKGSLSGAEESCGECCPPSGQHVCAADAGRGQWSNPATLLEPLRLCRKSQTSIPIPTVCAIFSKHIC